MDVSDIIPTWQQRTSHTGFPQLHLREVNDSLGRDEETAKSTYANICCFFVFSAIKQISYAAITSKKNKSHSFAQFLCRKACMQKQYIISVPSCLLS
jgi:hypothetical protein